MRLASAFAGSFYPESPTELQRMVERFVEAAALEAAPGAGTLRGGVVPHAGYVYSGRCAAQLYARLAERQPESIVLLGPSHRVFVEGIGVFDLDAFETPLGSVASNRELGALLASQVDGVQSVAPFAEHSLEVQLPFLRSVSPRSRVVALAFGAPDLELSRRLASRLNELSLQEDLVVVASSDLSHFHQRKTARRLDACFAARLAGLDASKLWEALLSGETEACGSGGVLALLEFARANGDELMLLDQCDSAAVTGDEDDVVGYLSAAVLEARPT